MQSAVADLLTPKGKAMKAYLKAIGADGSGGSGANTHSRQGNELAKRITHLLKRGELD